MHSVKYSKLSDLHVGGTICRRCIVEATPILDSYCCRSPISQGTRKYIRIRSNTLDSMTIIIVLRQIFEERRNFGYADLLRICRRN